MSLCCVSICSGPVDLIQVNIIQKDRKKCERKHCCRHNKGQHNVTVIQHSTTNLLGKFIQIPASATLTSSTSDEC